MSENWKTLGDIPKIKRNLGIWDRKFIKALHFFIYHKSGGRDRRSRIGDFPGFNFKANDEKYKNKVKVVSEKLSMSDLVSICAILEISTDSKDLMKHIFNHLIAGSLLKCDTQEDSNDTGGDKVKEQGIKDVGKEHENKSDLNEDLRDVDATQNSKYNEILKNIPDFIKPFRGCNDYPVQCWVKDFEDATSAFRLTEGQKLELAKKSVKGIAKILIEEKGTNKWDELKTILMNEFRSKMSAKALHEALKARIKRKNESALDYYQQMKNIANQGSLPDLDLMDYIIEGTPDDPWKVILYGAKSMNHFRQKLKDYDFIAKRQERIRSETLGTSAYKTEGEWGRGVPGSTALPKYNNWLWQRPGQTSFNFTEKTGRLTYFKCHRCWEMSNGSELELEDLRYMSRDFNGLPKKEVLLRGKRLYAMVDSGSQLNLINVASHCLIGSPTLKATVLYLRGFGEAKVPLKGYFEDVVQIDGYNFNTRFYVVGDDVLEKEVIIGSTLLQQAEFTIRRNEIIIRKVENPKPSNTNSSTKCVKSSSLQGHCTCKRRKKEAPVIQKPEEKAKSDKGSNHDSNLQRVIHEQQSSDLQNAVKNEKEKALEYQRKIKSAECCKNLKVTNNQANLKSTDRAKTTKAPKSKGNVKKDEGPKLIYIGGYKNEDKRKTVEDEEEGVEELKKKCAILEKSLIDLTKDCSQLRKEHKTVVNLLYEEKLKRKQLIDKFRDCRSPKKG